jgi:catechol 2,3-dioxygenase-like lactoylglutathione lyase family enzyme
MITGIHALVYSKQADAVRAFLRDVLGFPSVDAGGGWPIFALPPAEIAVHPSDAPDAHELYLMCDDLDATVATLATKGITLATPIREERWGRVTSIRIAEGSTLGIYQPKHPTAHNLSGAPTK